jgi:hypothetical protein
MAWPSSNPGEGLRPGQERTADVVARSLRAAAPLIVSRADSVPGSGDSGVQPGLVTLARCPRHRNRSLGAS